ncbi:MAG: CRISPR-associated endonuclease Cas1 [Actinomycetota bacterium]|nr:CRISPR-associated endonuclease Cas1 [Actinomycetota bacterium]
MQDQASAPRGGVVAVSGYGLKIYVERGHLVVHDGIADERDTQRFARVASALKRLVVLGQAGYVTLEALRWLRDTGAAFVHIDSDGHLVSLSASPGADQPALRRAQALAAHCPAGVEVARAVLRDKISGQAAVLGGFRVEGAFGRSLASTLKELEAATTLEELLGIEASAALRYWEAWSDRPVRFGKRDVGHIPAHWRSFGQRHSPLTRSPRLAANPANAILNYLYSLLEAEAILACQTVGLDPGLGVFHRDRKARDSLALDVMEACRPAVDAYVLALLEQRFLSKRDFVETRRGVCRILPPFARELASTAVVWRRHVAPIAEQVARMLSESSGGDVTPAPVMRAADDQAWEGGRRRTKRSRPLAPQLPWRCESCGNELPDRRRRHCDPCLRDQRAEAGKTGRPIAAAVLTALREDGRDPAHGGSAAVRRGAKNKAHQQALREWDAQNESTQVSGDFRKDVLPLISRLRPRDLAAATGLSEHYCALIRLGKRVPHRRHWQALRDAERV